MTYENTKFQKFFFCIIAVKRFRSHIIGNDKDNNNNNNNSNSNSMSSDCQEILPKMMTTVSVVEPSTS
jgi:hypothetical protein